jgi:glycosyltransferase involved in cell wall biosynthesis
MPKLAAGIICYNDAKGLKRLLDSIHEHVDYAFVIDGKYKDYIGSTDYSTDGSDFIAHSYPNVVFEKCADHQEVKRTKYLDIAGVANCDFLLVLDCDEYVTGDWKKFKDNLNDIKKFEERLTVYQACWNISYQYEPNRKGCLPRLIYKPYRFRYITHYYMVDKTEGWNVSMPLADDKNDMIEGITIGNDDNLRDRSRLDNDVEYQWYLFYKEGAIDTEQYFDKELKKKFADHIAYEYEVWK